MNFEEDQVNNRKELHEERKGDRLEELISIEMSEGVVEGVDFLWIRSDFDSYNYI